MDKPRVHTHTQKSAIQNELYNSLNSLHSIKNFWFQIKLGSLLLGEKEKNNYKIHLVYLPRLSAYILILNLEQYLKAANTQKFTIIVHFILAALRGLQDLSSLSQATAVKAPSPNNRLTREFPSSCTFNIRLEDSLIVSYTIGPSNCISSFFLLEFFLFTQVI